METHLDEIHETTLTGNYPEFYGEAHGSARDNGHAGGPFRYFGEETCEQMLPWIP